MSESAYARAGVDTGRADSAIAGLVRVLGQIDTGRPSLSRLRSGHYAAVVEFAVPIAPSVVSDTELEEVVIVDDALELESLEPSPESSEPHDSEQAERFDMVGSELQRPFGFQTINGQLSEVRLPPGWSQFAASISKTVAAALQCCAAAEVQAGLKGYGSD